MDKKKYVSGWWRRRWYCYCRQSQKIGQSSHHEVTALWNLGYENVYNISGSDLEINLYEYCNDTTTGKDKIVTPYNLKNKSILERGVTSWNMISRLLIV